MEERLPFFSIYIPPEWADHQSAATTYSTALKNLRENAANRLVTHFDVHATLMDVLRWPAEEEFDQPQKPNRSLSLFRPISLDRTCSEVCNVGALTRCLRECRGMVKSKCFLGNETLF